MNIAFIISQEFKPDEGGVQRSTSKLARIFTKIGHNVTIISLAEGVNQKFFEIPVIHLGLGVSARNRKKLLEIFSDLNVDLVVNQMGFDVSLTKLLVKALPVNTKLVNTLRINPGNFIENVDLFLNSFFKRIRLKWLNTSIFKIPAIAYHKIKHRRTYNYILENTDAFVLLNPSFINELKTFKVDTEKFRNKLFAISNPFEINTPKVEYKKENIILFVGRLNVIQKRVDLLMKIWKKLHGRLEDWKFWVVGDGPEMENCKEFCRRNNLNRVTFFGYDKPDEYYKKSKILHFTSSFEGFGNVLVEAQIFGNVPILFDSYSAAKDIVWDKQNGLLVEPFNLDDFVNKTMWLIKNPNELKILSNNAQNDVKRYSFESISKKWMELFEQIGCKV